MQAVDMKQADTAVGKLRPCVVERTSHQIRKALVMRRVPGQHLLVDPFLIEAGVCVPFPRIHRITAARDAAFGDCLAQAEVRFTVTVRSQPAGEEMQRWCRLKIHSVASAALRGPHREFRSMTGFATLRSGAVSFQEMERRISESSRRRRRFSYSRSRMSLASSAPPPCMYS